MGCSKEECCHGKNSCHEEESCHEHKHSHEEGKLEWLLEVADEAWEEVLKEKIKEYILENQGKKMEELAKIVGEANGARWKHKIEKKQKCQEFKEKLCSFFGKK